MRTKKIYCPVNGWDCPYYKEGECGLESPYEDCDDFDAFYDSDEEAICEDEERTAFEDIEGYCYEDDADECGYDPYLGCYSDDC